MIARILPGKLVGEFVIDVRSIYESKDHVLANKWAVLIDPKKPLSGPQGYVRVDLAFLGKDDIPKVGFPIELWNLILCFFFCVSW